MHELGLAYNHTMDHHQNTTGTTPEVAHIRRQQRKGILAGIACYLIWGFMALYWKQLDDVSPLEIICHRIIWCAVFCISLCIVCRWDFLRLFKERRAWCFLGPAAVIITLNWSIYIYAVSINHIIDTSLGYYINPLVTILLGLLIFKEHLTLLKWIAVSLCTVGIVFFSR